jgi:hypothetical protein
MAKRNPGNKPESNDRIPYVYVIPNGKVKLQADRIEDPNYVIDKQIELDYQFYITNQIMKPTLQFLEHIAESPEKIFENYINKEINRRKKTDNVNTYIGNNQITNDGLENNEDGDGDEDGDEDEDGDGDEDEDGDFTNYNYKSSNNIKKTKKYEKNALDKNTFDNNKKNENKDEDRLINKIKKTNVKQTLTINI